MFEYGLKSLGIKPSMEGGIVMKSEREDASPSASEGAKKIISTGALRGIIWAFAHRMVSKGVAKEEVASKINELLAAAQKAGDVDKYDLSYLQDVDWYARNEEYVPNYASIGESIWCLFREALEDAQGARIWASEFGRYCEKNLNENEKAILDQYEKTRNAYYEAERIRNEYFGKKARQVLKDMATKYSELLGKMDTELLAFFTDQEGVANNSEASTEDIPTADDPKPEK